MTGLFSLLLIVCSLGTGYVSCLPAGGRCFARCDSANNIILPARRNPSRLGATQTNTEALSSDSLAQLAPSDALNYENSASPANPEGLQWIIPEARAEHAPDRPPNLAQAILMKNTLGTLPKINLSGAAEIQIKQAGWEILNDRIRDMFEKSGVPGGGETNPKEMAGKGRAPANAKIAQEVPETAQVQPSQKLLWIIYKGNAKKMPEEELIRAFEPLNDAMFRIHVALLQKLGVNSDAWKSKHIDFMEWFSAQIFDQKDLPVQHNGKNLEKNQTTCTPGHIKRSVGMLLLSGKEDNLFVHLIPVIRIWYENFHIGLVEKANSGNSFDLFITEAIAEYGRYYKYLTFKSFQS
ncbi:hypothetical protein PtB15_2B769 [Puccinia triticina]|nr:hypothetical protein PtB15_2B769 [Puccinia triticina]